MGNTQTVGSNQAAGPGGTNQNVFSPNPISPVALPSDNGMVAWTSDPIYVAAVNSAIAASTLYLAQIRVPYGGTIKQMTMYIVATGVGLVANECFAGIYSFNPSTCNINLLASSSDLSGYFSSGGTNVQTVVLGGGFPITIPPGIYYSAFLINGTTMPTFRGSTGNGVIDIATPVGIAERSITPSTFTSLPSQVNVASTNPLVTGLVIVPFQGFG